MAWATNKDAPKTPKHDGVIDGTDPIFPNPGQSKIDSIFWIGRYWDIGKLMSKAGEWISSHGKTVNVLDVNISGHIGDDVRVVTVYYVPLRGFTE